MKKTKETRNDDIREFGKIANWILGISISILVLVVAWVDWRTSSDTLDDFTKIIRFIIVVLAAVLLYFLCIAIYHMAVRSIKFILSKRKHNIESIDDSIQGIEVDNTEIIEDETLLNNDANIIKSDTQIETLHQIEPTVSTSQKIVYSEEDKEDVNLIKRYVAKEFHGYLSEEDQVELVSNIMIFSKLKNVEGVKKADFKVLEIMSNKPEMNVADIRRFGWNIWNYFREYSKIKMKMKQRGAAAFIDMTFPDFFPEDSTVIGEGKEDLAYDTKLRNICKKMTLVDGKVVIRFADKGIRKILDEKK